MGLELTKLESRALAALRENAEGSIELAKNKAVWCSVYLDNVNWPEGPRSFAGVLGSLTTKGLYLAEDGFFGLVRRDDYEF